MWCTKRGFSLTYVHPGSWVKGDIQLMEILLCSPRAGHSVSLSDDCGDRSHSDTIRAICFSVSGALFASAGDDKLVKVWKTDSWRCIRTM